MASRNAILGFARLLEDDDQERPSLRQDERLRHIRRSATQLLSMVDEVLDLARTESGSATLPQVAWPLGALLQSLAARLAPVAVERGLALEWPDPETLVDEVSVDPSLAERAIGVLLDQVLRGVPRGTRVRVGAEWPEPRAGGPVVRPLVRLSVQGLNGRRADRPPDLESVMARRWIVAMGGDVAEDTSSGSPRPGSWTTTGPGELGPGRGDAMGDWWLCLPLAPQTSGAPPPAAAPPVPAAAVPLKVL